MVDFKRNSFVISVILIILIVCSSPIWASDGLSTNETLMGLQVTDDVLDVSDSKGSFSSLNNLINENNVVELDKDYVFNSDSDSALKNGIEINKDVVIEGNGFTIDGTNQSKLFTVTNVGSLTLKNIILLNDYSVSKSGIINSGNLIFDNVTFKTQKQVGGDAFDAAIVNEGNFTINNSNFKDSILDCDANTMITVSGLLIKNSGNLMIENTNITNNRIQIKAPTMKVSGALIYNTGSIVFDNVNMSDNTAYFKGSILSFFGFMLVSSNAELLINNSQFKNNAIIDDGVKSFAALANVIRITGSNASVFNSQFVNNTGSLNAGAIGYFTNRNEMVIENCLFDSNRAVLQGGAIFTDGNLRSNNNTYTNNFAGRNGGAIYVYGYYDAGDTSLGNFISTNDVYEYNSVKSFPDADGSASTLSWGGAICSKAGSLTIINDIFYRNIAIWGDGGAIANYLSSNMYISHSIFKENEATIWGSWTHASGLGGAILLPETEMYDEDHPAEFIVEYSIFDNNIATVGTALYSVPYKNVPCDFISNNNYWGSNNPFFNELIGKYQSSSLVFPDNYVVMEIEGKDTIYVGDCVTYKFTLKTVNENGVVSKLNGTLPDYEFTISSSLNPLSTNTLVFKNGEATVRYNASKGGIETFTVNGKAFKTQIGVLKYDLSINATYNADGESIIVTASDNVDGNISVVVNGITYNSVMENGCSIVNVGKLSPGVHEIVVSYRGNDRYNAISVNKQLSIEKIVPNVVVDTNYESTKKINLYFPEDATGRILFEINGKLSYANIVSGVVSLDVSSLSAGNNFISWNYLGDDTYLESEGNFSVNILVDEKITGNKNVQVYYTDGSKYTVRIFGSDGKAVGYGKLVTFVISGKSISVKTDKNGYASFTINQLPKTYTVITKYNKVQVKNTITVKNVLNAKSVTVKKANKIKYTVTVKGKKAFSGKKVTFKIKGKTYSAKTNKYGVATVYLKNLKVGKYNIVVGYANTKLTKTIKVKR